jgi:hypothetical protein
MLAPKSKLSNSLIFAFNLHYSSILCNILHVTDKLCLMRSITCPHEQMDQNSDGKMISFLKYLLLIIKGFSYQDMCKCNAQFHYYDELIQAYI